MRRGMLVALQAVLAGCATSSNYERTMDAWVGSTELALIRQWGPPDQTYEVNGKKFLTYAAARITGIGGYAVTRFCQTDFEITDGRIASVNWKGNDCKAKD